MKMTFKVLLAGPLALLTTALAPNLAVADGYTFTSLAKFDDGAVGSIYGGVVVGPDGDVYGTTGGYFLGQGSLFRIDGQSGAVDQLAALGGSRGGSPRGDLTMDSQGYIYGTTNVGGANGRGTVYRVDSQTGAFTTLADFNASIGYGFGGVVLDAQGNIYGTTTLAGGGGQVFKLDAQTGDLSSLAAFTSQDLGGSPLGGLTLDAAGDLYGTTVGGGANGYGSVYKIDAGTGEFSTLHSMTSTSIWAYGSVALDAQGDLFGATMSTVYSIDVGRGYSTLANLDWYLGRPEGGVTLDADGNIYFATAGQGSNGSYGTIQRIDATTGARETLFAFDGVNGRNPVDRLTIDAAGNIYGTTRGTYNAGWTSYSTVFRLSPTTAAVPEPAGVAMLAIGAAAVGAVARRRRR